MFRFVCFISLIFPCLYAEITMGVYKYTDKDKDESITKKLEELFGKKSKTINLYDHPDLLLSMVKHTHTLTENNPTSQMVSLCKNQMNQIQKKISTKNIAQFNELKTFLSWVEPAFSFWEKKETSSTPTKKSSIQSPYYDQKLWDLNQKVMDNMDQMFYANGPEKLNLTPNEIQQQFNVIDVPDISGTTENAARTQQMKAKSSIEMPDHFDPGDYNQSGSLACMIMSEMAGVAFQEKGRAMMKNIKIGEDQSKIYFKFPIHPPSPLMVEYLNELNVHYYKNNIQLFDNVPYKYWQKDKNAVLKTYIEASKKQTVYAVPKTYLNSTKFPSNSPDYIHLLLRAIASIQPISSNLPSWTYEQGESIDTFNRNYSIFPLYLDYFTGRFMISSHGTSSLRKDERDTYQQIHKSDWSKAIEIAPGVFELEATIQGKKEKIYKHIHPSKAFPKNGMYWWNWRFIPVDFMGNPKEFLINNPLFLYQPGHGTGMLTNEENAYYFNSLGTTLGSKIFNKPLKDLSNEEFIQGIFNVMPDDFGCLITPLN